MLFLPNKFEKYISSLRNYVQKNIVKYGDNQKSEINLRKIYICEAFLNSDERKSLNVILYSDSVLGASVIKLLLNNINLKVRLKGSGNYIINKKLFSVILLELISNIECQNAVIEVSTYDDISIMLNNVAITENLKKAIYYMSGFYFYDLSSKKIIIRIPSVKTKLESDMVQNEWEYILDKYSVVNLYFNDVCDKKAY